MCRLIVIGLTLTVAGAALAAGSAGSLDTAFGSGGIASTDFGFDENAYAATLQSDGKLVVVGTRRHATGPDPADEIIDWGVARYATNGSLDTTFGTNGAASPLAADQIGAALDVAIDANGKIIVVGYQQVEVTTTTTRGKKTRTTTEIEQRVALARLDSSGALDTTFGIDGVVLTDVSGGTGDTGNSIQILANGDILVAGEATFTQSSGKGKNKTTSTSSAVVLIRYNEDGSLDSGFGDGGIVADDFSTGADAVALHGLGVQADGKIVVAGRSGFVRRYSSDGTLDTSFASSGTYYPANADSYQALAVDGQDGILVSGYRDVSGENDGIVTRLSAGGSHDWTFVSGVSGADEFFAVALDGQGRVVAAGDVDGGVQEQDGYAARVLANGMGDASFGTSGIGDRTTPGDGGLEVTTDVLIDGNDDIVLVGGIGISGVELDWLVARYCGQ